MRSKEEYLADEFLVQEDFFVERSKLVKSETGLPINIWIGIEPYLRYGPRVKCQQDYGNKINKDNCCSISISDSPKVVYGTWDLSMDDFELVCNFIKSHRVLLLEDWNIEESYAHYLKWMLMKKEST